MRVLLIEPYYGGSHRAWVDGYHQHTHHDIALLTLPAQFWKWRMQGGAVTLARMVHEQNLRPDVILASDMFNLATFRALTHTLNCPILMYFHETQLTYPQNSRQKHGWQYGFVNYISALAADAVYFNSRYHRDAFFAILPNMLKHFGDYNELETVNALRRKSDVLSLGLDLKRYDAFAAPSRSDEPPIILWNHRWEEEKDPDALFHALYRLADEGIAFRVAITGENFRRQPMEFEAARDRLGDRVIQYGFMPDFARYARLLWQADYVVSTANQDFFGGAVAEAIYCGCVPVLPNRLNYPDLLPESAHEACLYPHSALYWRLRSFLTGETTVDTSPLRQYIAQFDWTYMAPIYDGTISSLAITGS